MLTQPKRVVIAGLYHETHTFIEGRTRLDEFDVLRGAQLLDKIGDSSPLGGAVATARELNWQLVPAIDMRARPGALADDAVLDQWWQELEPVLRAALADSMDGVFLILHGAMVCESYHDVEGEILQRTRAIVGDDVPIGGVTDLHANYSAAMARCSDALITYRENPHTDARDTAVRAAHILDRLMRSGQPAVTVWGQPPLMWPPTGIATAYEPMRTLEAKARGIELGDPNILAVNVHAGYSFADIADTGVSCSAVTVGDANEAQRHLQHLCATALEMRELGLVVDPTPQEVLPCVRALLDAEGRGKGPVLLVEPSDNIGGGAPGDGTFLLRAVLESGITNVGAIISDAEAVERISKRPPGTRARLAIGGKSGALSSEPIDLEVELVSVHDGTFELEDPHSHLAAGGGSRIVMGPCAVVRGAGITILLTSLKTPPFDLGQWRSQGIDPEAFDVIIVKAAVAHRRAYDPIARASFNVATPGPCTSDLRSLPFRHVRRPIFPLDP